MKSEFVANCITFDILNIRYQSFKRLSSLYNAIHYKIYTGRYMEFEIFFLKKQIWKQRKSNQNFRENRNFKVGQYFGIDISDLYKQHL